MQGWEADQWKFNGRSAPYLVISVGQAFNTRNGALLLFILKVQAQSHLQITHQWAETSNLQHIDLLHTAKVQGG